MKKVLAIAFSIICLFSFSILSFAADSVNVDDISDLDSIEDSALSYSYPSYSSVDTFESSSPSWGGSPVSFQDDVYVNGQLYGALVDGSWTYDNDIKYVPAVSYFQCNSTTYENSNIVYPMWVFEDVVYITINGFQSGSTYSGYGYVEFRDNTGGNLYYNTRDSVGTYNIVQLKGISGDSVGTTVMRSTITDIEVVDSNGDPVSFQLIYQGAPTYESGNNILWRIRYYLNDMYTGSASLSSVGPITIKLSTRYVFRVANQVDSVASGLSPAFAIQRNFKVMSSYFNGYVASGYNVDQDYQSDKVVENQNQIAQSQASVAESQFDELVNGYENSSGNAAIDSGQSAVESGVASEDQELDSAASLASDFDYEEADLSSLATAFSLISGWFMTFVSALGGFNMLIYVSLALVVALFAVGYFRH